MENKTAIAIMLSLFISMNSGAFIEGNTTDISTLDIVSTAITNRSCHNYCLTGVCVWLDCGLRGCSIKTSIRVRHYNPDLVVSVYEESGTNPWNEARALWGASEKLSTTSLVGSFHDAIAGYGERTEGGNNKADQSLRYKEATAIGHPLADKLNEHIPITLFCPSEARPFQPYFSSGYDALTWRLGLAEMLYLNNFLPGVRVVGEGGYFQQWGALFPRTGFVNQKNDVKAGAVVAQRVGSIVTGSNQPHVYLGLKGNNFNRTWLPGELIENKADTGLWQMLAPKTDNQCYTFGENDVFGLPWSRGRESDDKGYVYSLWRPYECCRDRGSLIQTIEMQVCL